MKQQSIIPKYSFLAALLLSILYPSLNSIFIHQAVVTTQNLRSFDFPLVEHNAINLRLNERLINLIEKYSASPNEKIKQEYWIVLDALNENIEATNRLISSIEKNKVELIDRSVLNQIEEKLFSLKSSTGEQANSSRSLSALLEKENYTTEIENFTRMLALTSENLSLYRDRKLELQQVVLRYITYFSIVLFMLIPVFWFRVIFIYRENLKRQNRLEEELEASRIDSIHKSKMAELGTMAGAVAHEINNPLTIISGHSQKIRKIANGSMNNLSPHILINSVDAIDKTIKRINSIIKALRNFSRDASNDPLESTNVHDVLADTLELSQARFKNLDIQLRYQATEFICVDCRPVELSQVFLNLLNNAVDAVHNLNERWIQIDVVRKNNKICISFADSGTIAEDVKNKLFTTHFTTKSQGRGSGLGLSISQKIIFAHNGELKLNENSKNTCFEIWLPESQKCSIKDNDQDKSVA